MGLFDKVLGNRKETSFTTPEAMAGTVLAAAAADGYISDEEAMGLNTVLGQMRLFNNWSEHQYRSTMNKLVGILRRQGPLELMEICTDYIPSDLCETAFAVATDIVLADGIVTDEEKDFISRLQRLLKVDYDLAQKIVEVMVIKNKG